MIKVEYIDNMGTDLTVVNAARVSFNKEKDIFDQSDEKLINYLAKHGHWTPFGHPQISVRVTAPFFVARQAFKHKVGLIENEISRRYVDSDPEYFMPEYFRYRAENKKQGSKNEPMESNYLLLDELKKLYTECDRVYKWMLQRGACPEQARMALPIGTMTSWMWTGSLAAFARVYKLRSSEDAQIEIQALADQLHDIISPLYPCSWSALTNEKYNLQPDPILTNTVK